MDYIFDVFFEEQFIILERSGLRTRQARTDVIDHLNGIIKGCGSGCEVPDHEAGAAAVVSAIEYHRRKKRENTEVCMMGKFHNILYIALKVCWDWGVKDSKVVSQLLEEIYSCEKTFERLFLGALFGTHAPYFIAGWRSDFKDQDENSRAMVFYMEHARRTLLEFPVTLNKETRIRTTRFIDVPIISCGTASPLRVALQASSPEILLILLRFGANPAPDDAGGMAPVMALLQKLHECENHSYPLQLRSCLTILLRTIPFIELPYKPHIFEVRREMFLCKYSRLFNDKLLPPDLILGVANLKHLCRCTIRERLRKNCQLPNGIRTLRVPVHLRRYIDLMEE